MAIVEPLGSDVLQPWQQLKAEELAKCERHLALPMAVDAGPVDFGVGVMPEHPSIMEATVPLAHHAPAE